MTTTYTVQYTINKYETVAMTQPPTGHLSSIRPDINSATLIPIEMCVFRSGLAREQRVWSHSCHAHTWDQSEKL